MSKPITTWFKTKNLNKQQRIDRTVACLTSEIMVRAAVEAAAGGPPIGDKIAKEILRKVRDNISAALSAR